jgi:hypothetical protein
MLFFFFSVSPGLGRFQKQVLDLLNEYKNFCSPLLTQSHKAFHWCLKVRWNLSPSCSHCLCRSSVRKRMDVLCRLWGQKYCVGKLLWLREKVDRKLPTESLFLWSCQDNLSNSSSMTHPNFTWSHEVNLLAWPPYPIVQIGSVAENTGIVSTLSFSTSISQSRKNNFFQNLIELHLWVSGHFGIIFAIVPERQNWIS